MCKSLLVIVLLFLFPLCATAQETPDAELFGGYSLIHREGGSTLPGWHFAVNGNVNKWFSLVADFSGHYKSSSSRLRFNNLGSPTFSSKIKLDEKIHTVMVGPRYSYRSKKRITPFAHTLFGVARTDENREAIIGDTGFLSESHNTTSFAAVFGAGLDVKLNNSLALRAFQADYLVSRLGFFSEKNNFRASFGIVFRFSKK